MSIKDKYNYGERQMNISKCQIDMYHNMTKIYTYIYMYIYTGYHRRKGPNFGRVFLMLNYTDITQNTYIQS